ncbi:Transcription initiation factor TFIID subunit 5 [Entophlyctis luteolus]|nr:Transcription initiation factor TFIID subunit 5 [Entophlyctis luteolus]
MVKAREGEASISDFMLFYSETEANNPNAYEHSYARLSKWVKDSLEKYRVSFSLLPRYFIETHRKEHTGAYSQDVIRLASITTPDQIKTDTLAQQFMTKKYVVKMSRYAFELLLSIVDVDKPGNSALVREEGIGLSSLTPAQLQEHNNQTVKLGSLPADPWMVSELEYFLRDEKFDAEPLRDELRKLIKKESGEDSPSRDAVPMPPPKFTDVKKEVEALKDLRNRMKKSTAPPPPPSICCYTFHNTYDTMTCLTSSADASLVCAGFSESILRVWSLKGEKLKAYSQVANKEISREVEGSECKRLVGHSGPVYAARISSENKFAISCSQDATVRLWSLETFSNLVVYKGHNHPVWDVDLSANDGYFASCSYDRTARLWRTDMINPSVKFHPNCNYVATGGGDGEVRLWSIQTGNSVRIMRSHTGPVMSLAFSGDGKMLATAGEDKIVKLWDLNSGHLIKNFVGHADTVYSLAFSPDSSQLTSAGADNSVIVWSPHSLEAQNEIVGNLAKNGTVNKGKQQT